MSTPGVPRCAASQHMAGSRGAAQASWPAAAVPDTLRKPATWHTPPTAATAAATDGTSAGHTAVWVASHWRPTMAQSAVQEAVPVTQTGWFHGGCGGGGGVGGEGGASGGRGGPGAAGGGDTGNALQAPDTS